MQADLCSSDEVAGSNRSGAPQPRFETLGKKIHCNAHDPVPDVSRSPADMVRDWVATDQARCERDPTRAAASPLEGC